MNPMHKSSHDNKLTTDKEALLTTHHLIEKTVTIIRVETIDIQYSKATFSYRSIEV